MKLNVHRPKFCNRGANFSDLKHVQELIFSHPHCSFKNEFGRDQLKDQLNDSNG